MADRVTEILLAEPNAKRAEKILSRCKKARK